jgi:hypothetical protein
LGWSRADDGRASRPARTGLNPVAVRERNERAKDTKDFCNRLEDVNVRRGSGAVVRRLGRRRWAWPVAAAGLVLVGRVLVDDVGEPLRLLRVLGDLATPGPIRWGR